MSSECKDPDVQRALDFWLTQNEKSSVEPTPSSKVNTPERADVSSEPAQSIDQSGANKSRRLMKASAMFLGVSAIASTTAHFIGTSAGKKTAEQASTTAQISAISVASPAISLKKFIANEKTRIETQGNKNKKGHAAPDVVPDAGPNAAPALPITAPAPVIAEATAQTGSPTVVTKESTVSETTGGSVATDLIAPPTGSGGSTYGPETATPQGGATPFGK